jgi:hypothetical protein
MTTTPSLRAPRAAALACIATLIALAAIASFAESYRALYEWALHHGLAGIWATAFPLQVDVFVCVGELALFVALADGWNFRSRLAAWSVTLIGLAVSIAGNVGHVQGHMLTGRLTAAIPPLAAAAALAVGLGVLKRVVAARQSAPASAPETVSVAASEPARSAASVAASEVHPIERSRAVSEAHSPKRGRMQSTASRKPASEQAAVQRYAHLIEAGSLPSMRQIQREMRVGQTRAKALRTHLASVAA